ncbi:ABC transporter ATP-binding protein [Salipiger sp. IMCC34102]|uniref:ABC transporter ATP-binding protein n=1 Tax=Salipiger sp. IMCC34102 TaxID=2510647 RepID=UPI00101B829E|nr:ABC transporter ATP-binding protein [Salipiger sp. IMCC34102]RYH04195.1 ABC transporter ATP-binding protein [Salipiger sp. IMCC34102]
MFRLFENLVDPFVDYPERDAPPRRLIPFLREQLQPFRKVFVWTLISTAAVAFIEVGMVAYLGRLVDLLEKGPQAFVADHGLELALAALFFLLLKPVIQASQTLLLFQTIVPNLGALGRWRGHRHVMRQPIGWFEEDFAGRLSNRVMQTPMSVVGLVSKAFEAVSYFVAFILGAVVLLAQADPRLLIPLLVWLVPYLALLRWAIGRVSPASEAASNARSALTGRVVDAYTNIHSVKMFSDPATELAYARDGVEDTRRTVQREMRIYSIMDIGLFTLAGVLVVGVVGWALLLWTQGSASVGVVAAAAALVLRLTSMSGWVIFAISEMFRDVGVIREGMETIADPVTLTDAAGAPPLKVDRGEIRIEGLAHHYGQRKGGLERIDLTIPAGQKLGVVGASGAGKSTLIKLLLRFYDAEQGRIEIDGQDISTVTQHALRQAVGMVQQDSSLLHRSVRENVLYGRPDATEAQMLAATRQAEAHDFILALTDSEGRTGYDALVGERGVKLSGGQRQRIALARVILKDAPILVLDEATSALDSEVEAAIQASLETMMDGKTVIAIAHRLSTLTQMDRIVVMDQGRIVKDGTHEALLAQDGLYARFWARQSGGFLGQDA